MKMNADKELFVATSELLGLTYLLEGVNSWCVQIIGYCVRWGMSEDYEGDTLDVPCMRFFCRDMVSERTMGS